MFEPLFLLLFFFLVVVVVVFVLFSSIIFYFFIPSSFDSQSSVLYIVLYDSTLPYRTNLYRHLYLFIIIRKKSIRRRLSTSFHVFCF